jgi:uncharacterized membrane protein YdbT with pleckstrin-like domain
LKKSPFKIAAPKLLSQNRLTFWFIRRNSVELLINKVEGIQVNQGILGRILGFGSITISGTGGTKNPFSQNRCTS